jgi:hypothetical protein
MLVGMAGPGAGNRDDPASLLASARPAPAAAGFDYPKHRQGASGESLWVTDELEQYASLIQSEDVNVVWEELDAALARVGLDNASRVFSQRQSEFALALTFNMNVSTVCEIGAASGRFRRHAARSYRTG